MSEERRNCSRCGELLSLEAFYFVSRKLGTRRGQCKACTAEVKREQKDPDWKPTCSQCGQERERAGPGRRLCGECFNAKYDAEAPRENGSHRLRLKNCRACGVKRLHADQLGQSPLCAVCRSVSQSRRTRLKRFFNMTPRDFLSLLEAQGNACAICRKPFTTKRKVHVDHQHAEPSIVRGLLCGPCNTLLGLARDNAARLANGVAYLALPPAQKIFPGLIANPEGNRDSWETFRPLVRK